MGGTTIYNAQRYYDTEQVLYIEIILSEEEDSIFCNARVVSIYPHSKDSPTHKLNLQFLDMSDADKERLKNYIERD